MAHSCPAKPWPVQPVSTNSLFWKNDAEMESRGAPCDEEVTTGKTRKALLVLILPGAHRPRNRAGVSTWEVSSGWKIGRPQRLEGWSSLGRCSGPCQGVLCDLLSGARPQRGLLYCPRHTQPCVCMCVWVCVCAHARLPWPDLFAGWFS